MAEQKYAIKNLNNVKLDDLESFYRGEIAKYSENEKLVEHFTNDATDFANALTALKAVKGGEELIQLENEFNFRFEQFMKPIDRIMNIWVEDLFHDFSPIGMTTEEGIRQIPEFAAADELMPPRENHGEPDDRGRTIHRICHCEGNTYGQIWPEYDLWPLMDWLERDESREKIDYLGLSEEWEQLRKIHLQIQLHLGEYGLHDQLKALRTERYGISLGMPLIISEIYPDLRSYDEPTPIDPRDICNPILETRAEQKMMEEFSFNDVSHSSFYKMAQRYVEKQGDIDELNGKIAEDLMKYYKNYSELYRQFSSHDKWEELQELESTWYRESERLILAIRQSIASFDADDPVRWKKHTETERYQSAHKLWDLFPHNPYDSIIMIDRGYSVSPYQWHDIRENFSSPENAYMLRDILAESIFEEALRADSVAALIAAEIIEEGEELLRKMRYYRERLTAVLNVISHVLLKK